MQGSEEIPELGEAGLRRFAWTTGAIIAVLFGLVFPWLLGRAIPWWPWLLGGGLATWGLLAPATLRPVYRGWMRFGMIMHRIMSPVLLGVIFFLVLTPVAVIMKLIGRKRVPLEFDPSVSSYRIESRPLSRKDMEKPF